MSPKDPATPEKATTVRLLLRSTPQVKLPDDRLLALNERDGAMLAYLAVAGATPRTQLAAMLWPDSNEAQARNALRQRVFLLRRQVGADLVIGRNTLALADGVVHDLESAESVLGEMAFPALAELQNWLHGERQRMQMHQQGNLRQQLVAHEANAHWEEALQVALRLLAMDPTAELSHRQVIRLHYLRGDRAQALLAFDRCAAILKDEVGTAPSTETMALLDSIQANTLPVGRLPGAAIPAAVLRPPLLVGRSREWRSLQLAWADCQPCLVIGDAGMGKSRILTDFVQAHATHSHAFALVSARPGDERSPYALLARLVRAWLQMPGCQALPESVRRELARIVPELGDAEPLNSDTQKTRFAAALAALQDYAKQAGLNVTVLDDLHFADVASLDLLASLIEPGHRWFFACRESELSAAGRNFIHALGGDSAMPSVALKPLTLADIAELLDSLGVPSLDPAALAPVLLQRSGGNPLFILETIKAMLLQGPDCASGLDTPRGLPVVARISALIERRLGHLSADAVKLARLAAVAGQEFSTGLACAVLQQSALDLTDAWAELEAAQVLRGGSFAHDLIYQSALESVPQPIRQLLHLDIARYLCNQPIRPARLAAHWEQAHAWEQAGRCWLLAAQESGLQVLPGERAVLLLCAAQCFDKAELQDDRFDALLLRVIALADIELGACALQAMAEVQGLASSLDQKLREISTRAQILSYRADANAIAVAEEGYQMAQACGRTDMMVACALPLAARLGDARRIHEGLHLLLPLREWVHANQSVVARAEFEHALAMALDQANQLAEALLAWNNAMELARQGNATVIAARALANKGATLAKMGLISEAAGLTRQGLAAMALDPGAKGRPYQTLSSLAHRLRDMGHYREAIELFESAVESFTASGVRYSQHMAQDRLSQLWLQLGQPARAKRLLQNDASDLPLALAVMRIVHRADLAYHLGQDALTPIRQAMAMVEDRPDDIYARIVNLFACAYVSPEEAEAMGASLAAWAARHQRMGVALAGHVRAAGAALRLGAPDRAMPHVDNALHLSKTYLPDSFYLPELWLTAARVMQAAGQMTQASEQVLLGQKWIERTAKDHVPADFRESFLDRNPVNLALRQFKLT